MTDSVRLVAPAKINLYLAVGARRTDGYHDLVTVFQALDERASDVVTVARAEVLTVVCEPDIGVPVGENLATRAVRALAELLGREPGLEVRIEKRIPAAGGLGGASSDAAAAIRGACRLWGVDAGSPEVVAIARRLGADVVFFLVGGTALFTGRGDVLTERLPTPPLPIVLVNPGEPVPTPAAYAAFDRVLPQPAPPVEPMLTALRSGDVASLVGLLHNDLSGPACDIAPGTGDALRFLRGAPGVSAALVSGSGSTVFGVCEDETSAMQAVALASEAGWWSCATAAAAQGVVEIQG
ncbi:MAG: 4-(cytidine 5'-diphospho)-2-C-methyl-D-erythritol kinase [Coriobacteriia bacterium]